MDFEAATETGAMMDANDILTERVRSMANETTNRKSGFTPKVNISDPEDSARFIVAAMLATIWSLVCFFGGVAVGMIFF